MILLMLVVLSAGLASWLTPKPRQMPGGAKTVFSSAEAGDEVGNVLSPTDLAAPDQEPSQNLANSLTNPSQILADSLPDPDDSPARITLFADLSRGDMTALLERLEGWAAEDETVEIVTYNTKNQGIIYENQVKSACLEKEPGVAILQDPGEKTQELAEKLKSAGYQVITLFSSEENTKNYAIRANIAQNWEETAKLAAGRMAKKVRVGEGFLLFLDGSSPETENAFRQQEEIYNFGTAYGYKNAEIAENYADFALKALPELGYMLVSSEELTQGILSGAETAKSLAAQGVEGCEAVNVQARFGALYLNDRVLNWLEAEELDFGIGVTIDAVFEEIQNILPDIQQGKYLGQRRLEPTIITPETAKSYQFGY